ncbi:MAG: LysM peptidoglycan-binding domain-containing protein [Caulobacteraceae bacterium]|nr:LysM peptidoglycan-binding domain-containing protein [Caulobacter sp.]
MGAIPLNKRWTGRLACLAAGTVAACASKPPAAAPIVKPPAPPVAAPAPVAAPQFVPTPGLDGRARLRRILELLDAGQRDQARADAAELVRQEPDNSLAKSLLNQIDADPKVLLGAQSFPYKIKPGETLSALAERFLHDKYLFYALARYNGIAAPGQAEVGATIMIPGAPREAAPAPPRRRPVETPPLRRPPPATVPAAPPPTRDPAHASALRRQALVQMNKGQIDDAVALLRRAAQLDPGDGAIAGDLARAERLQAASRR